MVKDWLKGICFLCGKSNIGGIITNGGSGDEKYVGLDYGEVHFYCIECWNKGLIPDHTKEIAEAFAVRGWCGYYEPYIGLCRNPKPCDKHKDLKCWKCGKPAVRGCDATPQLVCGKPECAEHRHLHEAKNPVPLEEEVLNG